jgi:hypothetical protein
VRIKSSAADLAEGESAILTLADANILAADGTIAEEADVLEEATRSRQADLERKRRCAQPSRPSARGRGAWCCFAVSRLEATGRRLRRRARMHGIAAWIVFQRFDAHLLPSV